MTTPSQARLNLAVAGANATVERVHGPAFPGEGKLLRVTWDLRIPRWEHHEYLGLPRRMASVSQATVEGAAIPMSELRLLSNGWIFGRLWVRWFGEVVADFVAVNDQTIRDGIAQDLATLRLHRPDADLDAEKRILDRLPRSGAVARQPVAIEVVDAGG